MLCVSCSSFAHLNFKSTSKSWTHEIRLIGLVILRPQVEVEMRDFVTPAYMHQ